MDTVTILALLTGLLLVVLVVLGLTNRVLLRLSLRNTLRRPGQTLLLLCGLALAAALITASYGLTDSLNDTARLAQVEQVGNLDESVLGNFKQPQLNRYLAAIRANPNVQVATTLVQSASAATITSPRTGFTSSGVGIVAVPADFSRVFGSVTDKDGRSVAPANLSAGQVDVSATLAESFDVQPGDTLTVSLSGQQFVATVRSILSIDIATSDFDSGSQPELVMSLSFYQQLTHTEGSASTIVIKNIGQGGMNDTGPNNSRSQAVAQFLRHLFGIQERQSGSSESYTAARGTGTHLTIIKPDLVSAADSSSFFAGLSPEDYKQFSQLLPALTLLLVGAGLLFLALLFILLGTERRAELGMSRAVGMQRTQIILSWLLEGSCYAVVASGLGLLAGSGMVALEIDALAQLHARTLQGIPLILPFHVWISGQSLLSAFCLSILLAWGVALLTALWISHSNIVAAIRDLNDPPAPRSSLKSILRQVLFSGVDADGVPVRRTRLGEVERRVQGIGSLFWGLFRRGPLCLVVGAILLGEGLVWQAQWASTISPAFRSALTFDEYWMYQLGLLLLLIGAGWLLEWLLALVPWTANLATRLGTSLIGAGFLAYGAQPGGTLFTLFQPPGAVFFITRNIGGINGNVLAIVLADLMLVAGAVMLVLANADLLVALGATLTSRLRRLAPLSRTSLAYPLTYRFRTMVTVSLIGMILFLIMLVVTINVGSIAESNLSSSVGGFQLLATMQSGTTDLPQQIQHNVTLRQDIAVTGMMRFPGHSSEHPRQAMLPGQGPQNLTAPLVGVDDAWLENTTMPLQARAQGFRSDQQVWDAVRTHPGDVIWRFEPGINGINPNGGSFRPFPVEAKDDAGHTHELTVVGIVAASTRWPALYASDTTLNEVYGSATQPAESQYVFKLRSGVSEQQATRDLMKAFGIADGLQVQTLLSNEAAAAEITVTIFFGSHLALGLLFGALALSVIMSRAVVERRQQIGMLRALGFSRGLVLGAFLLEGSFVITLSLAIGTILALWSAWKITSSLSPDFPIPVLPLLLILLGSYGVTIVAVALPARRATRVLPAEALRYE